MHRGPLLKKSDRNGKKPVAAPHIVAPWRDAAPQDRAARKLEGYGVAAIVPALQPRQRVAGDEQGASHVYRWSCPARRRTSASFAFHQAR